MVATSGHLLLRHQVDDEVPQRSPPTQRLFVSAAADVIQGILDFPLHRVALVATNATLIFVYRLGLVVRPQLTAALCPAMAAAMERDDLSAILGSEPAVIAGLEA